GGGIAEAQGELIDARAGRLEAKNCAGVDDILAGGARVHVVRRLGRDAGDLRGQLLDEGNGQRAGAAFAHQGRGIELRALADARNDLGVGGGQQTLARRGARQCALETRHRREQLLVRQDLGAVRVREEERKAQKSKNTVSFLPCSTRFHSKVPSGRFLATSVARRSAGTRLSTGSSAFAGSSGKYIRVTSCLSRPRMKTVTLRCGAWSLPSGPGARPGLMVRKRKLPPSSVITRPSIATRSPATPLGARSSITIHSSPMRRYGPMVCEVVPRRLIGD